MLAVMGTRKELKYYLELLVLKKKKYNFLILAILTMFNLYDKHEEYFLF